MLTARIGGWSIQTLIGNSSCCGTSSAPPSATSPNRIGTRKSERLETALDHESPRPATTCRPSWRTQPNSTCRGRGSRRSRKTRRSRTRKPRARIRRKWRPRKPPRRPPPRRPRPRRPPQLLWPRRRLRSTRMTARASQPRPRPPRRRPGLDRRSPRSRKRPRARPPLRRPGLDRRSRRRPLLWSRRSSRRRGVSQTARPKSNM